MPCWQICLRLHPVRSRGAVAAPNFTHRCPCGRCAPASSAAAPGPNSVHGRVPRPLACPAWQLRIRAAWQASSPCGRQVAHRCRGSATGHQRPRGRAAHRSTPSQGIRISVPCSCSGPARQMQRCPPLLQRLQLAGTRPGRQRANGGVAPCSRPAKARGAHPRRDAARLAGGRGETELSKRIPAALDSEVGLRGQQDAGGTRNCSPARPPARSANSPPPRWQARLCLPMSGLARPLAGWPLALSALRPLGRGPRRCPAWSRGGGWFSLAGDALGACGGLEPLTDAKLSPPQQQLLSLRRQR